MQLGGVSLLIWIWKLIKKLEIMWTDCCTKIGGSLSQFWLGILKKNPKAFWQYVGRFSGDKSQSPSVFRDGAILIEKDICKAMKCHCIFSSSFEASGTESSTKNECESSIRNDLTSLNGVSDVHLFSISKVLKVLRTLDTGKSPDIDSITNSMLKKS